MQNAKNKFFDDLGIKEKDLNRGPDQDKSLYPSNYLNKDIKLENKKGKKIFRTNMWKKYNDYGNYIKNYIDENKKYSSLNLDYTEEEETEEILYKIKYKNKKNKYSIYKENKENIKEVIKDPIFKEDSIFKKIIEELIEEEQLDHWPPVYQKIPKFLVNQELDLYSQKEKNSDYFFTFFPKFRLKYFLGSKNFFSNLKFYKEVDFDFPLQGLKPLLFDDLFEANIEFHRFFFFKLGFKLNQGNNYKFSYIFLENIKYTYYKEAKKSVKKAEFFYIKSVKSFYEFFMDLGLIFFFQTHKWYNKFYPELPLNIPVKSYLYPTIEPLKLKLNLYIKYIYSREPSIYKKKFHLNFEYLDKEQHKNNAIEIEKCLYRCIIESAFLLKKVFENEKFKKNHFDIENWNLHFLKKKLVMQKILAKILAYRNLYNQKISQKFSEEELRNIKEELKLEEEIFLNDKKEWKL